MSTWYYSGAEREQLGPVSTHELKQLFHSGGITPGTLIWRDGMPQWRPLDELAASLGLLETRTPVNDSSVFLPSRTVASTLPTREEPELESATASAIPGRAVFSLGTDPGEVPAPVHARSDGFIPAPAIDAATLANPYASGYATLQSPPGSRMDAHVVHAGFWKRTAAHLIDSVILGFAGELAGELFGTVLSDLAGGGRTASALLTAVCTLCVYAIYFAWFHSTLNFATPGKMAVGIKVLRANGQPIGFLRGIARFFGLVLGMIPFFLGVLMAAFTSRKQALHDLMCDTIVVDKWAFTASPEKQRTELGTVAIIVLALYALLLIVLIIGLFLLGMAGAAMLRG